MSKKSWPIFIVTYHIKWVTTSWTYCILTFRIFLFCLKINIGTAALALWPVKIANHTVNKKIYSINIFFMFYYFLSSPKKSWPILYRNLLFKSRLPGITVYANDFLTIKNNGKEILNAFLFGNHFFIYNNFAAFAHNQLRRFFFYKFFHLIFNVIHRAFVIYAHIFNFNAFLKM